MSRVRGAWLIAAALVVWGCASSPTPGPRAASPEAAADRAVPPGCPEVEACFAAAKAAIDRGDAATARERLLAIREQWSDPPWPGRAALLLATLDQDSDPASAIEWALRASTESALLGDRALALAAAAARRSGRSEQAAALFETLAREHPNSSLAPTALWSAGEAWQTVEGRQGDALANFTELAAGFPHDARAATALARVVSVGESDQLEQTGAACRTLLVEYPATADAASVQERCERLMRSGAVPALTFEQRRRRAELLGRGAKFADALAAWKDLKRAAPTPAIAREIELHTAITMYRLRRWDDAWRAFQRVATSDAAPELREEARAWEGRAAFRRDDVRSLRRAEGALASAFPDSPRRLELIGLRAAWYRGRGDAETALAGYQDLARAAADLDRPDKVVEASWNIAWIDYRGGRLARARAALATGLAAAAPSDPQIPQLLYWSTRFGEPDAGSDPAPEASRTLSDRFPYTYYGFLSRRGSVAVGDAAPTDAFDGAAAPDAPRADQVAQPDIALFPKAAELWFLGFQRDARDEVLAATRREPPAPDRAAEVAETLATVGADEEALRVVRRNFAPALERGDASLSSAIWRLAYPDHLLEPIKTRARDRVDPFLVSALIREESVYDPRALSPVGAIGLMQLMPDTGRRVARAEGLSDFSVDQLYRPEVNLTLGVRYLADLLDRFAGNEAYAVAAYNAGPEAVARWLENGPPRAIEEFVEEIPFGETRAYVKRVLRSAWLYHALYAPAEARIVRATPPSTAAGAD